MSDIRPLIPSTSSALSHDLEIVTAERIEAIENPLRDLWNVDTCPVHLLPWLAWAFSVEVWDHQWAEQVKRNVIRNAVAVHRMKGTRRSVELALEALNMRIDLHEWFELDESGAPYGPAHTFKLDAYAEDVFAAGFRIDPALYALVTELVQTVKPVHVHFRLRIGEGFANNLAIKTGLRQTMRDARSLSPRPRTHALPSRPAAKVGIRQRLRHSAVATIIPNAGATYAK